MHFKQYGKTFQLRIESAADLNDALELDESHWVATSAPGSVFRCDPDFIAMLDPDNSGRILSGELKKAIAWLLKVLADHSALAKRTNHIPLEAINQSSSEGADIHKSAAYIIKTLKPDADTVSLKLVRQFIARQKQQALNGDGILVPAAGDNNVTIQLINDIIATVGGENDASGTLGITEELVELFRQEVADCIEWRQRACCRDSNELPPVMPFGDNTAAMHKIMQQHADLIELFFRQCSAIRFEPGLASVNQLSTESLPDISQRDAIDNILKKLPLAQANTNQLLPLDSSSINPRYADWIEKLKSDLISPILGKVPAALTLAEWQQIKAALAPFSDYLASQKGKAVEKLSDKQLKEYSLPDAYSDVYKLIKADKAVADQLKAIHEVERLTLCHQHLLRFANNFICFSELYHPPIKAMFEEGSVQIDGRWFDLALRVDNIAQHSNIAEASNIFTLYLEIEDNPKFTIAVPATSGSKGNLGVGKRGIFFDWKGREHSAVVTKIIDNPISMREALAAPFVRLWEFVLGKIEAMSGSLEKKLQKNTDAIFQAPPKSSAPTPSAVNGPAGMLVGLSLSAAAIGSAFAFITKTLSGLNSTQLIAGIMGAAAVVVIPVSLIAALKLRRQDLSALLEGCGWSINARMRFNRAQRRSFTRRVPYPTSATGTPRHHWLRKLLISIAVIGILIASFHGCHKTCRSSEPPAAPQPLAPTTT